MSNRKDELFFITLKTRRIQVIHQNLHGFKGQFRVYVSMGGSDTAFLPTSLEVR